jgi:hypothetical protein
MEEILGIFIFGAVGLISFGVSYFFWQQVNKFLSQSLPAKGEIIGFEENHTDGLTYAPRVRFRTGDGRQIEFTDSVFSNPPGYEIGESIRIFHHRCNLHDARIAKTSRLYFLPGLFLVLGIASFGGALVIAASKIFF